MTVSKSVGPVALHEANSGLDGVECWESCHPLIDWHMTARLANEARENEQIRSVPTYVLVSLTFQRDASLELAKTPDSSLRS